MRSDDNLSSQEARIQYDGCPLSLVTSLYGLIAEAPRTQTENHWTLLRDQTAKVVGASKYGNYQGLGVYARIEEVCKDWGSKQG